MAAATVISGAGFGAALAASGIYRPNLIIAQMRLEDFTMMRIFLTATLSGGLAIGLAQSAGIFRPQPRSPATKGWFSAYDGNIIGGLMQGAAMALTGACPGTGLVQAATGIRSGYFAVLGALVGGLLHNAIGSRLVRKTPSSRVNAQSAAKKSAGPATIASAANLSVPSAAAIGLLAGAAVLSVLPTRSIASPALLAPTAAGAAIGLAQLSSILFRKKTMGVSTAYEEVWQVALKGISDSVYFAAGVAAGGWTLARLADLPASPALPISSMQVFLGGVLGIFGARLAGGCTSGHGISGVPTMGLASVITTACMFAGGIPVALALA